MGFPIKIAVVGAGLAAVLGAGSVLLSFVGNANSGMFLVAAIAVFAIGIVAKKI